MGLRQYASWCHQHQLRLFQARCADIECFTRDLQTRGPAWATTTWRLRAIAGFDRYACKKTCSIKPAAAHIRRPADPMA